MVLRDLSLELQRGAIVGVVGENGSGKTTLVRLLAGVLSPDHGTVSITGRLGYCPQETLVFGDLTVQEHFRYFAAAYRVADWRGAMDYWLDRLGFRAHAQDRVDRLSGGTRQKLNLAMAIFHDPDVILLDEPYGAFDWKTYTAFWEIAKERRSAGQALLLVSPLVHDLKRFDLVYELSEGALRCSSAG